MIVAPLLGFHGIFELISIADVGTTFKPTVYSTCISIYDHQDLPTEPLGSFILTLTNVIIGSSLWIESTSGVPLYSDVAASNSPTISLSAYANGNPLNSLRIKVRKGSTSPYYQPWQTLTTAIVGSQSIYVSQISDE